MSCVGFFCLFVSEKHPFKYIGACLLTSSVFFTSYFRSPNWQRHLRSFIPYHFIIFGQWSGPPGNLRVPDFRKLGSRPRTSRQCSLQQNGGHKTQNTRDTLIWSCSKRMWGLPVREWWLKATTSGSFGSIERNVSGKILKLSGLGPKKCFWWSVLQW